MRAASNISLIAIATILFVIAPVSATYVLSNLTLAPGGPPFPGVPQEVIATYVLLPSGPTTFVPGHNLQMLTNLTNASWNIQVIVDGRNAARQTASGTVAFVNGEILSYPATRDVSFAVTITGRVPGNAVDQLMVLQVGEVDNTGGIVPGSASTLNEPLAGQPSPTEAATPVGAVTALVSVPAASPSPTKSSGFASGACIAALSVGLVLLSRHSR